MLTETHIAHPDRIQSLLDEAENELKSIQPRIEELEHAQKELSELKQTKQRLLALKMSLQAMLSPSTLVSVQLESSVRSMSEPATSPLGVTDFTQLSASKTFYPDKAFEEVEQILKHKGSLNYQIFQAVVYKGGKATTEDIKLFLVETGAKQPQTGEGFENEPLSQISSRANYLVRKGILYPTDRGSFYTHLGWSS